MERSSFKENIHKWSKSCYNQINNIKSKYDQIKINIE